jgi:hypothetical protein
VASRGRFSIQKARREATALNKRERDPTDALRQEETIALHRIAEVDYLPPGSYERASKTQWYVPRTSLCSSSASVAELYASLMLFSKAMSNGRSSAAACSDAEKLGSGGLC